MRREFIEIDAGWANQYYFGAIVSDVPPEADDGMRGFAGNIDIQIVKGGRAGDIIRTDDPVVLVVSEKFVNMLRENSFQSYSTYTVRIFLGDEELEGYQGLAFCGKGGCFLPEFSDIVYGPPNEKGQRPMYERKRLAFDITEWDGSDLFYIPDFPAMPIITQNVADALKRAKIKNYELTAGRIIGVDPNNPDC